MKNTEWVRCPVCGNKTRNKISKNYIEVKDMVRPLKEKDIEIVCRIVNENWKNVYAEYINPLLLNMDGCAERMNRLKLDFATHRLSEFVWEEKNKCWQCYLLEIQPTQT